MNQKTFDFVEDVSFKLREEDIRRYITGNDIARN